MAERHTLRIVALPDRFAISKLDQATALPTWASSGDFCSITRTADELSVVCPQHLVPPGVQCERDWRCLRIVGAMDFSMVGVVASLVTPLAGAGISVFVVSTFDTDYLLVKDEYLDVAMDALRAAGHVPVV